MRLLEAPKAEAEAQTNRADWGCVTNRADWGLSLSDYLVYNNRLGLYNCKQADIAVV